ncbi:aldolase/citrate lyase family protein [Pseudomonas kermanshahensis]|uniref:HpcH/HpaI aldolase family protein n=1 Tax=Pseudomonas kermanshahensis TaxID=2745482 RepID=UPI0023DC3D65|nr:aldolase/citrate lyase family protein [Pseudomonas kermanshahensis]WEL57536.1 aldolase/citrate lyase family protein [Pseudomonas kermanshahensis]
MKHNNQKSSFLAQQPNVGCWLNLGSPAVAEAISHCGFDWLLIDCEHASNDDNDVIAHLRAIDSARAHGASVEPIVRVAWNDPVMVKRVMDSGAQTVMFPTIETLEQARKAVASTRFPQNGNGGIRGIAGLARAGRYTHDSDYLAQANQQASAILQIETAEGVKNVKEIAQLEGVDCLFIGPADLAASLGHLGNQRHPEVLAAIDVVVDACNQVGKVVGIFAASAEDGAFFRNRGLKMIALHSDVVFLIRGAANELNAYKSSV